MVTLFRVILIALFSLWFGGFTFYVSFVVPIGTEVLGSTFDQGMITRRVTIWLNYAGAAAILLMMLQSAVSIRKMKSRFAVWFHLANGLVLVVAQVALFALHPYLDGMIDVESYSIKEGVDFYTAHRIYLWVSTLQWLAAWGWLIQVIHGWTSGDARRNSTLDS